MLHRDKTLSRAITALVVTSTCDTGISFVVLDVLVVELMLDDVAIGRHLCMCGCMFAILCGYHALFSRTQV